MLVGGEDTWYKDYNYKICYRLKLDNDSWYEHKRVISKILKLDENSQYCFAILNRCVMVALKRKKYRVGENLIFCSKQLTLMIKLVTCS